MRWRKSPAFHGALLIGLASLLGSSTALGVLPQDPSFGNGGAAGGAPGQSSAAALALQPDRKIVAVGTLYPQQGIVLVRFNPNGSLDAAFGNGGIAIRFGPPDSLMANAMALQPDGRILVAGTAFVAMPNQSFFVARFLTNGDPDPAFGTGGLALTDFPGLLAGALAMRLQADGKPVLAGFAGASGPPATSDFAAVRHNMDGSLDSSFGAGGRVVVDMGGPGSLPEAAEAVAIQAGGRIVLGGVTNAPSGGFTLAGLLPDGSLDPSFGFAGRFSSAAGWECRALALQPDGRIVAAGSASSGMFVVRLSANGVLDPTFGAAGTATLTNRYSAFGVAIDPAGRIVLGGQPDFVLARLLPNGQPDTTVGPDGWQSAGLDFGGNFHARAHALVVQDDGRIILGGDQDFIGVSFLLLLRYLEGIAPVPTLSAAGWLSLVLGLGLAGILALRRIV